MIKDTAELVHMVKDYNATVPDDEDPDGPQDGEDAVAERFTTEDLKGMVTATMKLMAPMKEVWAWVCVIFKYEVAIS